MRPGIPQALLQRQPKSAPGLGVEHRLVVRLLDLRGLVEPARSIVNGLEIGKETTHGIVRWPRVTSTK